MHAPLTEPPHSRRDHPDTSHFYRALVDHALDIVTVVDRAGTMQFKSPSTLDLLGYSPDELIGRSMFSMIHPDDQPAAREAFERGLRSAGRQPLFEYRCRHRDGRWLTLEAAGHYLLDYPGGPMGIIHSRNITERKVLETQVRHAQKMEPVARFTSSIVHDFNNLIAAISGSAEMLGMIELPEAAESHLMRIRSATDRATTLTRQLLAFARRHPKSKPQPVHVHDSIALLRGILEQLAGPEVFLTCTLEADDCVVMMGHGLLDQVLVNLVTNARDAMPDGGTVTVATRSVSLAPAGPCKYVAIEVSDTGTGMTLELQSRIFEPFFTTKDPDKGTGLGLSTVCSIVQQAGGRVQVDSIPGEGSTFRVLLPLRRIPAQDPKAPRA